jgi:hypothetical protein
MLKKQVERTFSNMANMIQVGSKTVICLYHVLDVVLLKTEKRLIYSHELHCFSSNKQKVNIQVGRPLQQYLAC